MWCQAGGPEALNNGLACCSLHHQAFDRGGMTITDDHKIVVSPRIYGNARFHENFVVLHQRPLSSPCRKAALPKTAFLAWHRSQVFRGPARD